MYSTGNYKSSASVTPYKGYPRKNIVTTKSYPFQKYPNLPRKGTEPHVTKPQYEGSENSHIERSHSEKYIKDNSHTERSHGEKYIKVYKDMEEFPNK